LQLRIGLPLLGCQGSKPGSLPGSDEVFSSPQGLLNSQIGGKALHALTKAFVLGG
jgi:hypothetical protein